MAILEVVAIGAGAAVGLTLFLTWLVLNRSPRQLHDTSDPGVTELDVIKIALSVVAGIGGAVALVVAYRRQQHLERDEAGHREQDKAFRDRYGTASQQLGDPQPAVRLAGVYAMANLADEWPDQRQQCVDVLCAYLRLPWIDAPGQLEPGSTTTEHTWPDGPGQRKVTRTYAGRAGEREVRRTLIRIISDHLQDDATLSWSSLGFDFRQAQLPDARFENARFKGPVIFRDVRFSGEADFTGARFTREADFNDVTFTDFAAFDQVIFDEDAYFGHAVFNGGASFSYSTFANKANFSMDTFAGDASFENATFNVLLFFDAKVTGETNFSESTFTGWASFGNARFTGNADFSNSAFTDEATFRAAVFTGYVAYAQTAFTGQADFDRTEFAHHADFLGTTFTREIDFNRTIFTRTYDFDEAHFLGGGGPPNDPDRRSGVGAATPN